MSATTQQHESPRQRMLWTLLLGASAVAMFSTLVPLQTIFYGSPLLLAMPLIAGLSSAPLLARTHPRIAIAVFCAAVFWLPLSVSPDRDAVWPWPWSVPALIGAALFVFVITFFRGWRTGLIPWGVGMAGALIIPIISLGGASNESSTVNLIVTTSITGAAFLVACLLKSRMRISVELTQSERRTESEQSKRLHIEERARIAREMHDIVAHSMSVIQVQASSARYRLTDLSDSAAAEFDDIAATSRASLAEMRRLLGVLRTDDQQPTQLAPQQSLSDISMLVDNIRRAGAEVVLSMISPTSPPPQGVQLTAYRIVQEALSNAVRHAPSARIHVEVTATTSALMVRVHNDAPATKEVDGSVAATGQSGGHGLHGMQERVDLTGGSLITGPDNLGGWVVTAILPTT